MFSEKNKSHLGYFDVISTTLHFFNEGKETNILVSILCARLCAKCFPYVSQHPMRKIVLFLFNRPGKAK